MVRDGSRWFDRFEMFERFEGFLMECLLKNHFQVRVEKCFFCLSSLLLFIAQRAVGGLGD